MRPFPAVKSKTSSLVSTYQTQIPYVQDVVPRLGKLFSEDRRERIVYKEPQAENEDLLPLTLPLMGGRARGLMGI